MFEGPRNLVARARPRLARHIVIVLLVKIVLLTVLWHVFIKPHRVAVSIDSMGGHIIGPPAAVSSPATAPASSSFPSSHPQENTHDRPDRR